MASRPIAPARSVARPAECIDRPLDARRRGEECREELRVRAVGTDEEVDRARLERDLDELLGTRMSSDQRDLRAMTALHAGQSTLVSTPWVQCSGLAPELGRLAQAAERGEREGP